MPIATNPHTGEMSYQPANIGYHADLVPSRREMLFAWEYLLKGMTPYQQEKMAFELDTLRRRLGIPTLVKVTQ